MDSHLKVLVVDDSTVMRKVIRGILESFGFLPDNILEAVDGQDGLDTALAQPVDVILMDWNMPRMLGIDTVKGIRAAGIKTPILMVTTEGEKQNIINAIQAGASNYLVKPFNAGDLREKVEQLLGVAAA